MQWVDSGQVAWQRFAPHRPGFAENKRLLSGQSDSRKNFELSLVHVDSHYATPRHKHNFDQIRFMLKGEFGFNRNDVQREGSLSYFPEGTPYIQRADGESITLLLQFGGASGAGFLSYADLDRGKEEMDEIGRFEDGLFVSADSGKSCDAYEAIWQHIRRRPVRYPLMRYRSPIVADPQSFDWIACSEESGVYIKQVGQFTERHIGMGFLKCAAGSAHTLVDDRLYYLLSGSGTCDDLSWGAGIAVNAQCDGPHLYTALEESEFVFMDRPGFRESGLLN